MTRKKRRRELPIDRERIAEDLRNQLSVEPDPAQRARLLLLLDDLRSRDTKKRPSIAAAAIFVLCFALAGVLVLKRVNGTAFTGRISTSALKLQPADASQSLLRYLRVREIRTTEATYIARHVRKPDELPRLVRVTCQDTCEITFDGLDFAGVLEIQLQRIARNSGLRVDVAGANLRTQLTAEGNLLLEDVDGGQEIANFTRPEKLTIVGGPTSLSVDVSTLQDESFGLSSVSANAVDFHTAEEEAREGRLIVTERSSILNGELHLRPVDRAITLVHDDELVIDSFSGRIYQLTMNPDHFDVAFAGNATNIRVGEQRTSVLPSVLESFRARSGLAVYWASALWLTSVLMSLMQWYRVGR
jgi:hypothetical protein